jgi:hypothetical protein
MSAKIPSWIVEKQKNYEENPKQEFVTFPENKTVSIEIDITIPAEEIDGKFNKRMKYTLKDGKKMTIPLGFDRVLVEKMMLGQTKFTIFRSGKDKETRYSIVES